MTIATALPSMVLAAFGFDNILAFLGIALGLGLVIFFHELGHFAVAKWCNVNVERFSIGFGPIIWSRQRGETEYALSAIPFGGYVKMLGQDDMDPNQMSNEEIALDPRSYPSKTVFQRMAIISAGVIMNVITGLLFFAFAFKIGVWMLPATVGTVITDSPAYVAGIEQGDQITHVNGKQINNFMDVTIGVTLSSGDVQIAGVRRNGDPFDYSITPDYLNGTRRTLGIEPTLGMTFGTPQDPNASITPPGTPASRADPGFMPGDKIVAIDGNSVTEFADMVEILARKSADELTFDVERGKVKTVESIVVGTNPFRTLGIWMGVGRVSSIRNGSVAQQAGFEKDDVIVRVNELVVGTDIDPLRLPNYFAAQHGQEVEVEVRRQQSGGGDTTATLKVTPDDKPGWLTRPYQPKEPLTIPAIGLAFPIIPRIVKVDENSQSFKAGLREGQTVTKIEFITDEKTPTNGRYSDGAQDPSVEILLEVKPEDDKPVEQINWAYAHWLMQSFPNRWVKLTVNDGGPDPKVVDLKDFEYADDWFLPIRGFRIEMANELRQASSFSDAFFMGISHTRNTALQIYMTLRSLVMQELSPKELHGPIGIAKVGYQVAEQGVSKLLLFLGFLSINLAVLNFLPIPVLDGGHMVFLIWEGITRRKPSEKVMIAATYIGMAFVLSLMMFVLYLDIFVHP